ncbi:hypothetical protein QQ008_03430 [Fulvivirgaceae bacterium BMA10]|uniref:Uncharacterized protein n=1 Tax=Splendidivirga corallicola TaxID=3051826 RepID=A0ABT8KI70_9BACT|nr:hypothetical protein [Fulvivirgaceae bacterium BMA10]
MTISPLSEKEIAYITDVDFLLTKSTVIKKVVRMFSEIEEELRNHITKNNYKLPEGTLSRSGKISRGENYKGLPYVMLDYPRLFSDNSVFACRSMFWWGHFFNLTLHIQGEALEVLRPTILSRKERLKGEQLFIGVNETTPWEHDYDPQNYCSVDDLSDKDLESILRDKSFVKLSVKTDLKKWLEVPEFILSTFKFFMNLVNTGE